MLSNAQRKLESPPHSMVPMTTGGQARLAYATNMSLLLICQPDSPSEKRVFEYTSPVETDLASRKHKVTDGNLSGDHALATIPCAIEGNQTFKTA